MAADLRHVLTSSLEIACEQTGPANGRPVLLLHGWPYSPRCYDGVVERLHGAEPTLRLLVPYLRGFGPTLYRDKSALRSGQQAAIGKDVVDLLDALEIPCATLVGYDWGGRAACVAAALWPERVQALLSVDGYAIQSIAKAGETPAGVEQEHQYWYQWYFQTERGRIGLATHREELTRKLWGTWSPSWPFDGALFAASAESFRNPDFVATTIHSYRHRYGNAKGDPALEKYEKQLAAKPKITVPTLVLHGEDDRVQPPSSVVEKNEQFGGAFEYRSLPGVGHCPPQEVPETFAAAIQELLTQTA